MQVIGFSMFYGMWKSPGKGYLSDSRALLSEYIKPHPLYLPFLLRYWRVLHGARTEHMANEQQRTTCSARNRGGRGFRHSGARWYSLHVAPWIAVFSPQLHVSDDHVHRHVCLYGAVDNW